MIKTPELFIGKTNGGCFTEIPTSQADFCSILLGSISADKSEEPYIVQKESEKTEDEQCGDFRLIPASFMVVQPELSTAEPRLIDECVLPTDSKKAGVSTHKNDIQLAQKAWFLEEVSEHDEKKFIVRSQPPELSNKVQTAQTKVKVSANENDFNTLIDSVKTDTDHPFVKSEKGAEKVDIRFQTVYRENKGKAKTNSVGKNDYSQFHKGFRKLVINSGRVSDFLVDSKTKQTDPAKDIETVVSSHFVENTLDTALMQSIKIENGGIRSDKIVRQLSEPIKNEAKRNTDTEFSIKLKPEGLGEVLVGLKHRAGKLDIEIKTSLMSTKELISSCLETLKRELVTGSGQKFRLSSLTVIQEPSRSQSVLTNMSENTGIGDNLYCGYNQSNRENPQFGEQNFCDFAQVDFSTKNSKLNSSNSIYKTGLIDYRA